MHGAMVSAHGSRKFDCGHLSKVHSFAIERTRHRGRVPPQATLGDSSTVEQRTLTPLILVRIQVPQPKRFPWPDFSCD